MSESGGSRIYTGRRPEENSNAIHQWQLSSKYYQIISYTNVPATHMIIPKIIIHTSPCAAVDWPRGHEFTTVLKREDNWRQSSPFHVLFIFLSRLRVLIYHKTTPNFRLDSSKKKNRTSPNATEHVLIKLIFFPHSLSLCFNHIFSNLAFHTAAAAVAHLAAHGPRHPVPTPACRPAHMRILITLSVDFDVCKWIELNWDWLHQ